MNRDAWTPMDTDAPLPASFVGPAQDGTPHPVAAAAARTLLAQLADPALTGGVDFLAPGAGKMFGVLVVVDAGGARGFLRGFSGMVGQRWFVPGFVPPLFDAVAQDAFYPEGEAELERMRCALETLHGPAKLELVASRRKFSQALWRRLQDTYRISDAAGVVRTTTELFAPRVPPGGAGDCAGPKLLGAAYREGSRPVALAEVWWGAKMGARTHGSFHAPCLIKCGAVLAHMLGG